MKYQTYQYKEKHVLYVYTAKFWITFTVTYVMIMYV